MIYFNQFGEELPPTFEVGTGTGVRVTAVHKGVDGGRDHTHVFIEQATRRVCPEDPLPIYEGSIMSAHDVSRGFGFAENLREKGYYYGLAYEADRHDLPVATVTREDLGSVFDDGYTLLTCLGGANLPDMWEEMSTGEFALWAAKLEAGRGLNDYLIGFAHGRMESSAC